MGQPVVGSPQRGQAEQWVAGGSAWLARNGASLSSFASYYLLIALYGKRNA